MKRQTRFEIGTFNINLPAGFERRAAAISREAIDILARLPVRENLRLATLSVPGININGSEANSVLAQRIAQAIHLQINNSVRERSGNAD